jgi:hypothetical protein
VEGCSCMGVCPCEMTGVMDGCQGFGAIVLDSGTYNGTDVSGAKMAYAGVIGKWIRVYVQPKSAGQDAAVKAFARSWYSAFGKVESVRDARLQMDGTGGRYTVMVDGGKIAKFTTVPVIGGDKKTPIVHTNVNDPIIKTMMQGKTVSGSYHDGKRAFTLKGSNSYFNSHIRASGVI